LPPARTARWESSRRPLAIASFFELLAFVAFADAAVVRVAADSDSAVMADPRTLRGLAGLGGGHDLCSSGGVLSRQAILRIAAGAALTFFGVACSSEKTYDVTFTCTQSGGAACVKGQTCPTMALDAGGCEDLPGLFDHPPTKVDAGRPVGCEVGLSYGNPFYGDSQQTCFCQQPITDAGVPSWSCGI
jgi:hypothetical protein